MTLPTREVMSSEREGPVAAFLEALARAPAGLSRSVLADALDVHLRSARERWPRVSLLPESYARYLAERCANEDDVIAVLSGLRGDDLYLACACAAGDPRALSEFESTFMPEVGAYVARLDRSPAFADEVRQQLRAKLFVSSEESRPKIHSYSGRGPLGGWLRVAAVRTARNLQRDSRGRSVPEDEADRIVSNRVTPELDYLRERYARELRAAFESTLQALAPRERNILRLYFVDSMSSAAIAAIYKVSSATIRAWLKQWREDILANTRARLATQLRAAPDEVDSVIGLLQSQFEASVSRLLR